MKVEIKEKDLGFVSGDILRYLQDLKRYGHRGQTINEIYFKFWGIISERAVRKQIYNLKKWKFIKEKKIDYSKSKKVIFYEAKN